MSTSKIKILIIKLSNASDAIEASTLFIQQQVVESANTTNWRAAQYQCVGQAWWN
jgi:hypothetical protein